MKFLPFLLMVSIAAALLVLKRKSVNAQPVLMSQSVPVNQPAAQIGNPTEPSKRGGKLIAYEARWMSTNESASK